jgi:hypothetical protein
MFYRKEAGMSSKVRKAADDLRDAVNETRHRANATAEHVKRAANADRMSPGQKVKSYVREDVEDTKADIDRVKRKTRKRA